MIYDQAWGIWNTERVKIVEHEKEKKTVYDKCSSHRFHFILKNETFFQVYAAYTTNYKMQIFIIFLITTKQNKSLI